MINKQGFIDKVEPIIDWIAEYLSSVDKYPVRSESGYAAISNQIPNQPPQKGESIPEIFSDFKQIILPGITHWQSPNYFAYFPANSSEPSVLAEFLTSALGVQGMKWITSPAATELEEKMMDWLRDMLGLPTGFKGVIQDTASVATLCAILAAREMVTGNKVNEQGMSIARLRIYCSSEAHSSIEKAVRIAGIGSNNLVKIPVDEKYRMQAGALEKALQSDVEQGYVPCCIITALGTTGTCSIDPIEEAGKLAKKYNCWMHVDAAFAGSALVIPEFRKNISGLELADSFVFNPHKWMFTNFDCSAFFVQNPEQLEQTFSLVPAYLQTNSDSHVKDYSNFGIQLGRRFRALKLWFVIRNFGVDGIRERISTHIHLAEGVEQWVLENEQLQLMLPRNLSVVCFRYFSNQLEEDALNQANGELLEMINSSGKLYMSHTMLDGKFTLRLVIGQTYTERKHVEAALETIQEKIDLLNRNRENEI